MSSEKDRVTSLRPTPRPTLRERLRQQAVQAEADAERQRADDSQKAQAYEQYLKPTMLAAAEYFSAIVADLETIQAPKSVKLIFHASRGGSPLFHQSDYQLFIDDKDNPRELSVSCTCQIASSTSFHVGALKEADELEQLLREMGINYHRRRQDNRLLNSEESSRFLIDGHFVPSFTIRADDDNQRLELLTRNLEDKPERSYRLAPDRIDDDFLENLGMLLLRETDTLIRTEVSPALRRQWRSRIEQEKQAKLKGKVPPNVR